MFTNYLWLYGEFSYSSRYTFVKKVFLMYNQQTLHKEEALALLQELFFLMYSHVIQFKMSFSVQLILLSIPDHKNVILGTAHPIIHSGSHDHMITWHHLQCLVGFVLLTHKFSILCSVYCVSFLTMAMSVFPRTIES